MPQKIYIVDLTADERTFLLDFIKAGERSARKLKRAHILLLADEGQTDSAIAQALHTSPSTVQRTRRRFVEGNLERALHEDPRPGSRPKLDEKGAALRNVEAANFIETAIVKPGAAFITRAASGIETNLGGAIEVEAGGVILQSFSMK